MTTENNVLFILAYVGPAPLPSGRAQVKGLEGLLADFLWWRAFPSSPNSNIQ
jgi:hypothetical protein